MKSPGLILNRLAHRLARPCTDNGPIHVFHHLPKCGGTSVLHALSRWFRLVRDYRDGWSPQTPAPIDLRKLSTNHCLCGHFDHGDLLLGRRYPSILADPRLQLFTFVRDPLEAKLSLYHYERKHRRTTVPLERFLLDRPNYLSERFPLNSETFTDVVARYAFIGTTDNLQSSFDRLAELLGKPDVPIGRSNAASKSAPHLHPDFIAQFKEENQTDYALYRHAQGQERGAAT